jgi:spermidine synthase
MSIMAIELCASRVVAPYFGTSTFVWTNVIGVMLVALSLGYLAGGRLADRRPELRVILRLLLLACAYLLALPYAAGPVLGALSNLLTGLHSSFAFIFAGSLAAIVLLFAPPIVVMGMTGPFLIRVLARQGRLGEAAGRVFGVSTLGSVLGTFLPALVFVPAVGTSRTIAIFAGVLLVVVALGLRRGAGAAAAAVALALVLVPMPALRKMPGEIWAGESAYETVEVIDRGDLRYLAYDDAIGWESVASKTGRATGMYFDYYARLPEYLGRPARTALILGLGGGVIANELHDAHPGLAVTGVEIDPLVIGVARRYFNLNPQTRVVNQDGRIFVRLDRGTYDIAVVDAYARQLYIPFHLATRQFFREVKARLAPDGLLAMNVSSSSADSPLMRALRATLRTVFAHVYTMRVPGAPNYMLLAGDRAPSFPQRGGDAAAFREDRGGDAARALTDDRAPVEFMMDRELLAQASGFPAARSALPR